MATIITTDPDNPYSTEIAGVGVLGGNAKGGIPAERAAQVVAELQDDDGNPLSGAQLRQAAERFAKARGLSTRSVKDLDEEALRVESGAFPRGKTIEEFSREMSERDAAFWQADQSPRNPIDLPTQETALHPAPADPPVVTKG